MNISYQREMKRNYLIIRPEQDAWRSYECQMMEENTIFGLLRFQVRQVDGETLFYYEITSKQPLRRMLDKQLLSGGEIRALVMGIAQALNQVERYLLQECSIMLDPEFLYVEPETLRIWLCLVPGLKGDFPLAYGKLLEYFLEKVNHQDKESVVLAYGLYQETKKENYGMEDILKALYREGEEQKKKEQVVSERASEHERISTLESFYVKESVGEKSGFWKRFKSSLSEKFVKEQKPNRKPPQWSEMFIQDPIPVAEPPHRTSDIPAISVAEATASSQDTVLLYESPQKEEVRTLYSLEEGGESIPILYYPFVIGKQESLVDHVLNKDTVSRIHLRIDRSGDQYQITDLNSTNGTMVGGILLNTNEAVTVNLGDEVQIARFAYRLQ